MNLCKAQDQNQVQATSISGKWNTKLVIGFILSCSPS